MNANIDEIRSLCTAVIARCRMTNAKTSSDEIASILHKIIVAQRIVDKSIDYAYYNWYGAEYKKNIKLLEELKQALLIQKDALSE